MFSGGRRGSEKDGGEENPPKRSGGNEERTEDARGDRETEIKEHVLADGLEKSEEREEAEIGRSEAIPRAGVFDEGEDEESGNGEADAGEEESGGYRLHLPDPVDEFDSRKG